MGFKKDLEELEKFKQRRCSTKHSRYVHHGDYAGTVMCPYYDITIKKCSLNACIRGGIY